MPVEPTNLNINKIFENISKVKLRGGVVGKVSTVLMVACASMAAIAWSAHMVWVSVIALGLVFILCITMLWRLVSFADRNPKAALLEGAEFLIHEQLTLGMKGNPVIEYQNEPTEATKPNQSISASLAALPDQVPPKATEEQQDRNLNG